MYSVLQSLTAYCFLLRTLSAYGSVRGSDACVSFVSLAFHVCIAMSAFHCMPVCVSCACTVWAAQSVALCLVHVACCLNSCATGGLLACVAKVAPSVILGGTWIGSQGSHRVGLGLGPQCNVPSVQFSPAPHSNSIVTWSGSVGRCSFRSSSSSGSSLPLLGWRT